MAFIFLDESGQFSKQDQEKYFVIASFTIGDQRRTDKAFRSWCRTRFPKKMRGQSEVKWSSTHIDEKLRLRTLRHIAKLDVRIRFVYLLRDNIPHDYWKKNKLQGGLLYTNMIGELIAMFFPLDDTELRIFCDRRHLAGLPGSQFKEILKARLLPGLPRSLIFQIEMVDSTTNANIQIADWIAGAFAAYLEKKPLGEQYYRILKNNLLHDGKELFSGL